MSSPGTINNSQSSHPRPRTPSPATPQGSMATKAELSRSATKSPGSKLLSVTVTELTENLPAAIVVAEKSSEVTPAVRETKRKSIKIRLPKVQNSQSVSRSRTPTIPESSVAKNEKGEIVPVRQQITSIKASFSDCSKQVLSRRRCQRIPTAAILLAEISSEEENEVTPDVRETKRKSIISFPKRQNSQSVQTPPPTATRKFFRAQSKSRVEEVEVKTRTTPKTESRTPRRKSARKKAVAQPEPVKTQTPSASTSTLEWKFSVYGIPKCPLPCRETQFEEVWKFLFENVTEKNSGCMYITGVPGTGKTVIVQSVIDTMKKESEGKDNRKTLNFKYLYINGLTLASPDKIWKRMSKALELQNRSEGISTEEALKHLDSFFEGHQRIPVVLVVDELDQILDKQQTILYQLLEWSSDAKNMFSFVAIFNTMSPPEHGLDMRNYSRMGFKRSVFPPYNKDQLQTIVMNILGAFKTRLLTEKCVSLLSRKVAAISGDVRRALEIARRTLEIAESENVTGIQAVSSAFKEICSSAKIETIKYSSLLEQLVMRAICDEIRYSGVEEVLTAKIYENVTTLAKFRGMQWEKDAILKALMRLAVMGLVIVVEDNSASLHKRVLLKVPVEDVNFALGLHNTDTDGQ